MTASQLDLQREEGYAILTLNRPDARNALSPSLLLDLCAAFRSLQGESDILAVILTGAGEMHLFVVPDNFAASYEDVAEVDTSVQT